MNKKVAFLLPVIASLVFFACSDEPDPVPVTPDDTSLHILTGTVSITGVAKVGQTLTADTAELGGTGTIAYQWKRGDSEEAVETPVGEDSETYILIADDLGKFIQVTVTRADYTGEVSSEADGPVMAADAVIPALTGTVTITGTAKVGLALGVNTDGLGGSGTISYQWSRGDTSSGAFSDISGATSANYMSTSADLNKYIQVTVTRANNTGDVTGEAVGPVAAADTPAPAVSSVTVSPASVSVLKGATQQFNATVNGTNSPATTVTWTVTGGISGTGISTGGLLTIAAGETASSLTVRATSTADTAKSGAATVTIPNVTGTVTISGTARVSETLTASLSGSGMNYQWTRGDTASGAFTNISGATSSTYVLTMADLTKYIKVTVTRTGYNGSVTSATAIGPVQQPSDPTGALTSVSGASSIVTDGARTGVMKIDMSVLSDNWAVAIYSLAAYKDKEITITISVDVKQEGASGNLKWQINQSPYPSVASASSVGNTWTAMTGSWTGTPTDANPAMYLNNEKTSGITAIFIDNLTLTIALTNPFTGGETLNTSNQEQVTRKLFGYDYELWNEKISGSNAGQGTAIMQVPAAANSANGGIFKCEWDGINNVLFRAGRKYGSAERKPHGELGAFSIEYDVPVFNPGTVSGSMNAYISVYGWVTGGTPDALIEYYIVENWGEFNPKSSTGAVSKGSFTIAGEGTYELYTVPKTNAPSIEGNKNFMQYFSIRTERRQSGTISVTKHFEAWGDTGAGKANLPSISNGKLTEVAFKIESYGGTSGKAKGNAEVTKNILKINGTPIN